MKIIFVWLVLLMAGCASTMESDVFTQNRPLSYYGEDSAFTVSGNLLDEDLERLINHQLKLRPQNRIAILKLSNDNYWRFYSNDFAVLSDKIAANFVGTLRGSDKVYDASYLPAMLVPEQRTVNYLREAAARYQADVLLTYRSNCQTFEKYRFIAADEVQAYCSVETMLLDIRTGIVPFTNVVTEEFFTQTDKTTDLVFRETVKRAELEALGLALQKTAQNIVAFLQ